MTPVQTGILILAALFVVLLLAMWFGWRGRARRTVAVVPALPELPTATPGGTATLLGPVEATYVTTTVAGDWLERVTAHGLGPRSAAQVHVRTDGVLVERTGAPDLYLPVANLRGVETRPGMAGKYVGASGLVVLTWQPPGDAGTLLDTGLRTRRRAERDDLITAVAGLVAGPAPTSQEQP